MIVDLNAAASYGGAHYYKTPVSLWDKESFLLKMDPAGGTEPKWKQFLMGPFFPTGWLPSLWYGESGEWALTTNCFWDSSDSKWHAFDTGRGASMLKLDYYGSSILLKFRYDDIATPWDDNTFGVGVSGWSVKHVLAGITSIGSDSWDTMFAHTGPAHDRVAFASVVKNIGSSPATVLLSDGGTFHSLLIGNIALFEVTITNSDYFSFGGGNPSVVAISDSPTRHVGISVGGLSDASVPVGSYSYMEGYVDIYVDVSPP